MQSHYSAQFEIWLNMFGFFSAFALQCFEATERLRTRVRFSWFLTFRPLYFFGSRIREICFKVPQLLHEALRPLKPTS